MTEALPMDQVEFFFIYVHRYSLSFLLNNFESFNNLGLIYLNLGNVNEAIESYLKSLKFNPNNIPANYNLVNLYKFDFE